MPDLGLSPQKIDVYCQFTWCIALPKRFKETKLQELPLFLSFFRIIHALPYWWLPGIDVSNCLGNVCWVSSL